MDIIEVNNLTEIKIKKETLKKIVKKVLEGENPPTGGKEEVELSIVLLSQERIRMINKKYRGKDCVTDVLAFPELKTLSEKFISFQKMRDLGEVVLCPKKIKENARKYNVIFEKELARILIHGVLHLLGYDHEKGKREAGKMRKKEEFFLSQCQS